MSDTLELQKLSIDKDLVALDEMVGDCSIPQRDWNAIITLYNQNNRPFPIPPESCAKILKKIKDGIKPSNVFKERGLSYSAFMNRYKKDVTVLANLSSKSDITDDDYLKIISIRHDPYFLLGQDISRVRAFHFNEAQEYIQELSKQKPGDFLTYLKEFHPDQFEEKQENKGAEIIIQFAPGILESI